MTDESITLEAQMVGNDTYLAAPIVEPEQIKDEGTKRVVTALAVRSAEYVSPLVTPYSLLELPEEKDPRSLVRRVLDGVQLIISSKRGEVMQRISTERTVAKAQAQAEWLGQAVSGIKTHMEQLRKAYEGIANYTADVNQGLKQLEQKIFEGKEYLASAPVHLEQLQNYLHNKAWYEEREADLGKDGAEQCKARIAEEAQNTRKQIAHIREVLSYLALMQKHYAAVRDSSQESLGDIHEAMNTAQLQRLDLAQTLHTYKGLTQHQIAGIQAIQFLRDVARITARLKGNMNDVHGLLHGETRKYALNAPAVEAAPIAEPEEIRSLLDETEEGNRRRNRKLLNQGETR